MKFIHAIEIGFEILGAIESVLAGGPGVVEFSYQGKKFQITVSPKP